MAARKLIPSRLTPIGVELGSRSIHAVQLRGRGRGRAIEAVAALERFDRGAPIDPSEVERLVAVLDRQGFRGRNVVISVPRNRLLTALLDLPAERAGVPRHQIAQAQLAAAHKCSPQTLETAYWEISGSAPGRDGVSALAVGCRHEDSIALIDSFRAVGRTVIAIDAPARAAARAVAPQLNPGTLVALLATEWTSASLTLLRDGLVVYERELGAGGLERLHAALVDEIDLDADVVDYLLDHYGLRSEPPQEPAHVELVRAVRERVTAYVEQVANDLQLSLGYATKEFGFDRVSEVLVVGELGAIDGVTDPLARALSAPARTICPDDLADCHPTLRAACETPALITAFGLALHPGEDSE